VFIFFSLNTNSHNITSLNRDVLIFESELLILLVVVMVFFVFLNFQSCSPRPHPHTFPPLFSSLLFLPCTVHFQATINHSKEDWNEALEFQPSSPHLRMLLGEAFISVSAEGKVRAAGSHDSQGSCNYHPRMTFFSSLFPFFQAQKKE